MKRELESDVREARREEREGLQQFRRSSGVYRASHVADALVDVLAQTGNTTAWRGLEDHALKLREARGNLRVAQVRQRGMQRIVEEINTTYPQLSGIDLNEDMRVILRNLPNTESLKWRNRPRLNVEHSIEFLKEFSEQNEQVRQTIMEQSASIAQLETAIGERRREAAEIELVLASARARLEGDSSEGGMSDAKRREFSDLLESLESDMEGWGRQGFSVQSLLGDIEDLKRDGAMTELRLDAMRLDAAQAIGRSMLGAYLKKRDEAMVSSLCEHARGCFAPDGADGRDEAGLQDVVSGILDSAQSKRQSGAADNGSSRESGSGGNGSPHGNGATGNPSSSRNLRPF